MKGLGDERMPLLAAPLALLVLKLGEYSIDG
jgi:hypothetical protein